MRKLSELFQKKPESTFCIAKRIEIACLVLGGTFEERFAKMRAICLQHPELQYSFESNNAIENKAFIYLTNQPLTEEQTEEYVCQLAKKQNHVKQLSHPALALS
jgi:hypothetical protein